MRVSRSLFLNIYNLCHAKLLEVKNILLMFVTPSAPKAIYFDHRHSIPIRNGIEFLNPGRHSLFSSLLDDTLCLSFSCLIDSMWWHPRHLLPPSLHLTPPLLCDSLIALQGRSRDANVKNGGADMGWIGRLGFNIYTTYIYIYIYTHTHTHTHYCV